MNPTIEDVAHECFGRARASQMLDAGAIHPINDPTRRKRCFIKNVQHGYFDPGCTDWDAVGLQAGRLSGLQVVDIDDVNLIPKDFEPNVVTRRGAHFYGPVTYKHGTSRHGKVDLIANGNVVFFDLLDKKFIHAELLPADVFTALVESLLGRGE